MNVLSTNFEFSKISSSTISKTSNKVVRYLLDSGIDVEKGINQTPLKLQRLKLSSATRKHHYRKEDYMDISQAKIPIPNIIDFNLLLLEELDKSVEDLKTVWVHTVTSKFKMNYLLFYAFSWRIVLILVLLIFFIDSADQLTWSDSSIKGDVIAWGFSTGIIKIFKHFCTVIEPTDVEMEEVKHFNEEDMDLDSEAQKKQEKLQRERSLTTK